MTLYKINPGIDTSFSTKINNNFGEALSSVAANNIITGSIILEPIVGTKFTAQTDIDKASSQGIICNTSSRFIAGGSIYDTFDDSSISSLRWTTASSNGSITENSTSLAIQF